MNVRFALLLVSVPACMSPTGGGGGGGGGAFLPTNFADGGALTQDSGVKGDAVAATDSAVASTDACAPTCANKQCGENGCGGVCGSCATGWACVEGGQCLELAAPDLCKAVTCDANAYCTAGESKQAKCVCKPGFHGDGKACIDIDECLTANGGCDEHALCDNKPGASPTCECVKGWAGNGKKCFDVDECKEKTAQCVEHALCKNEPGDYACACEEGFSGDGLQLCKDVDECKAGKANCGANMVCDNTLGSFICSCAEGFKKQGGVCVDIDECALGQDECDANATCKNTVGSYQCACNIGFKGSGLKCSQDKDCAGACDQNAECVPVAGKPPQCKCSIGFSGPGSTCFPVPMRVTLNSVTISPFDPDDNKTWDGGPVSQDVLNTVKDSLEKVLTLFGAAQYAALIPAASKLVNFVLGVTSPPDPKGTATLTAQGLADPYTLPEKGNTLNPSWAGVEWTDVIIDSAAKLTVALVDVDFNYDDSIGTATVSGPDLMKALAFGTELPIPVNKQGKGGILLVHVVVTPMYACGNGKCELAAGEESQNCPQDCGAGAVCGNGKCEAGETAANCKVDCGGAAAHPCDAACGAQAPTGCYCDAECLKQGDCCTFTGAKAGPGGTCAGSTCKVCQ